MKWTTLTCARCGKKASRRVLYGLPSPETLESANRGEMPEVVFGGCNIGGPPPHWLCDACSEFFGDDLAARRRCIADFERRRLGPPIETDFPGGGTR